MNLLLDTGNLGLLCHPRRSRPIAQWLAAITATGGRAAVVYVPEITDYELRRKLLHLVGKGKANPSSIEHLDVLAQHLEYLPLDTWMMRRAAELWAQGRAEGLPTAHEDALDCDIILAAQSLSVNGTVVTKNRKHLSRFVPAMDWTEIPITT